jgi:hypothetical protein
MSDPFVFEFVFFNEWKNERRAVRVELTEDERADALASAKTEGHFHMICRGYAGHRADKLTPPGFFIIEPAWAVAKPSCQLSAALENFISELRADPKIPAETVSVLDKVLRELEHEGIHNYWARQAIKAFDWVAGQTTRAISERLAVFEKLIALPPGAHILRMSQFTGWTS